MSSDKNDKSNGNGNGHVAAKEVPVANFQTIALKGALDRGVDQVEKAVAQGANVLLDFHECNFISVDGLEWLEELIMRADSAGVVVKFVRIQPTQYKVFKVAHIQSLLKACGSPPAGIAPAC